MDSVEMRTVRGVPSRDAQHEADGALKERPVSYNTRNVAEATKNRALLTPSSTSDHPTSVDIKNREVESQKPTGISIENNGSNKHRGSTKDQHINDDQSSLNLINENNSELGNLFLSLKSYPEISPINKEKIDDLTAKIDMLISCSMNNSIGSDLDTNTFLAITLANISERLSLIKDCLDNSALPEENINCLYNLATLQLDLFEIPYTIFGLMVSTLEENQPKLLPPDALVKTKEFLDNKLSNYTRTNPMGEEQIKQFMWKEMSKSLNHMKSDETNIDKTPFPFEFAYRLHKNHERMEHHDNTSDVIGSLSEQFQCDTTLADSVFPLFSSYLKFSSLLESQFISLLVGIDKGNSYSEQLNNYDLQAERWSLAVLKHALSGNGSENIESSIMGTIDQLGELVSITDRTSGRVTGGSSFFLEKLFNSPDNETLTTEGYSCEALIKRTTLAYEDLLVNGLIHFVNEILDNHQDEGETASFMEKLKNEITQWVTKTRSESKQRDHLKEFSNTIEKVATSMEKIRKQIIIDQTNSPFGQMIVNQFNEVACGCLLSQTINSSPDSSPIEQLASTFQEIVQRIESQSTNIFNRDNLVRSFGTNCTSPKKPLEPWQLQFFEAILSTKKLSTSEKPSTSDNESLPKADFLRRNLKSPSALGKCLGYVGNLMMRGFTPTPYHEKHRYIHDTSNEGNGVTCRVNLCCSHDEGFYVDGEGNITIDWKNKIGNSPRNHLQDYDANHSKEGMLDENISGFDNAIPTHHTLKNWYEAFIISTAQYFSQTGADKAKNRQAFFELRALSGDKTSVDLDHSDFLIQRLRTLWSPQDRVSELSSLENMVSKAVGHYRQHFLSPLSPQQELPVDSLTPMKLSEEQIKFCKNLSPFFTSILNEIFSKDFRIDLTADFHSVQIMMQIAGFLSMPVSGDEEPQKMHQLLGISETTFQTLEEYARRLTSEHFENKQDLLAERFYEMFAEAPPLSKKKSSFLANIKNRYAYEFMTLLQKNIGKKEGTETEVETFVDIKSAIKSVQQSYDKALNDLKVELKKAKAEQRNGDVLIEENTPMNASNLSSKERCQILKETIKAGKESRAYFASLVEELEKGGEQLTKDSLWNRIAEAIEKKEGSIICIYAAAMVMSVYYLAMGATHPQHKYTTGGVLSFGSFQFPPTPFGITPFTSWDLAQVATTAGSIITQVAQSVGWRNDICRMLNLLKSSSRMSMITSDIPAIMQSHMFNLHLSKYQPDQDRDRYQSICEQGVYLSGSNLNDTVKDAFASLLTRESPLQKSHPKTDKLLRVVGSTATGAAQGLCFSGLSHLISASLSPYFSWVPTISEPVKALVALSAAGGAVSGLLSETRFDSVSRAYNVATRPLGKDRIVGGLDALTTSLIKAMQGRKTTTQVRLLIENPIKAALNVVGSSIPESAAKFFLHCMDGFVAENEILHFTEWRKQNQWAISASRSVVKAFEGKPLTQYDLAILKGLWGEQAMQDLKLAAETKPEHRSSDCKRMLVSLLYVLGHYIMVSDLHHFLYKAIRYRPEEANNAPTGIETTEQPEPSQAFNSLESTSTFQEDANFGENTTDTIFGNTINEASCPADTKELPQAGKGLGECVLAIYEAFRRQDPAKRFFNVATFKSIPNAVGFFDVKFHNESLGKKSIDPAMTTTLVAGAVKNSALGPGERLLQMSPEILAKCIGDIVNQLNTNLKEAVESVGQRDRDKATPEMKKAGKDLLFFLLKWVNYDLAKAEKLLAMLISYWRDEVGFPKLNAIACLRAMIADMILQKCPANQDSFDDYKNAYFAMLAEDMPSVTTKSPHIPPELIGGLQKFKGQVDKFLIDTNNGADMISAATRLSDALGEVDLKVVDAYLQYELYKPLMDQTEVLTPSPDTGFASIPSPWSDGIRQRHIPHQYQSMIRV